MVEFGPHMLFEVEWICDIAEMLAVKAHIC